MAKFWQGKFFQPIQSAPTLLTAQYSNAATGFFGRTTISSAAGGNHFIPAGPVGSDSLIFLQPMAIVVGSESLPSFVVRSINVGSGFIIGPTNSFALVNSITIGWEIKVRS
jgi:hypothetical protein